MTTGDLTKGALDVASAGVVVSTLTAWLPPIAAAFSIIWCALRIYEWVINKRWLRRDS